MAASRNKSKKGKIRVDPPPPGRIDPGQPPQAPDELVFSFKYWDPAPPIGQAFPADYWHVLLNRLRDLSGWRVLDFLGNRNPALKAHGVNWAKSNQPDGFRHLNQQLRDAYKPYQFSLRRNNYGRVFGFMKGPIFCICWLDPNHEVTGQSDG